jgi:hypothetical protein
MKLSQLSSMAVEARGLVKIFGRTGNDFWLSLIGALVIMAVFSFITVKAYTRKAA